MLHCPSVAIFVSIDPTAHLTSSPDALAFGIYENKCYRTQRKDACSRKRLNLRPNRELWRTTLVLSYRNSTYSPSLHLTHSLSSPISNLLLTYRPR